MMLHEMLFTGAGFSVTNGQSTIALFSRSYVGRRAMPLTASYERAQLLVSL